MYTAAIFALTMGLVAAQNEQIYATFYDDVSSSSHTPNTPLH